MTFLRTTTDEFRELLREAADSVGVREILAPVGFSDVAAAQARLQRIAGDDTGREMLSQFLPNLLVALTESGAPDQALVNFERFSQSGADRTRIFRFLCDNPRAIEILVRLFVGSQFLTEILLCNPQYLERLTQRRHLADLKSVQQLSVEAGGALVGLRDMDEQFDALRQFQRWELLRIGVCDFVGLLDLRRVTVQLSLLADALVRTCLGIAYTDSNVPAQGFTVVAMGKLGGEELNYSSDIDLLFICQSSAMSHWRIGQRLIKGLTNVSANGFLYRVDMRLRPWGRAGELVSSLDSHIAYLLNNAQLWEKQALLKARVIAGDPALGAEFLKRAEPLLFNCPPDQVRASVRGMKQRIEADLLKKGKIWGEVKLGEGSIRDVEFLVQYLQLIHGEKHPEVRSFNTLDALVRLTDVGFLHADEYRVLTDGYVFLRTVEHALQLVHNKQTHELPSDPGELRFLARRLDFSTDTQFIEHYNRHCVAVRAVYERYLGAGDKAQSAIEAAPKPGLTRHLSRLEHSYAEVFSNPDIEHHAALAERIDEKTPVIVDAAVTAAGDWRVTIVGYDYLGELSMICGLLLVYDWNIVDGQIFTYEPMVSTEQKPAAPQRRVWKKRPPRTMPAAEAGGASPTDTRQKIVDVFTVRRSRPGEVTEEDWRRYADDLTALLKQLQEGAPGEAQGALAKRVASALRKRLTATAPPLLYPIDLQIDNEASEQYTVLRIRTRDTLGFLYELTNALSLNGVYISRVQVGQASGEAFDTLYVTDAQGRKIVDPAKQRELQAATVLIKHFTHLLPQSPNPESALLHFREFVAQLFTRPDWPDEIVSLEKSEVLNALARLLGVSDFLWNDFLRMQHANLFPLVRDVGALAVPRSKAELLAEARNGVRTARTAEERRDVLNAFKDREMFRVDMRHILGYVQEFGTFSEELTDVAEAVVEAACELCEGELRGQFGMPQLAAAVEDEVKPSSGRGCRYSVCALGKCGGRELGFASDIELMFLYEGEGKTTGPQTIASSEFYVKLVEGVTHAIRARREGIFEIDLRLRPYGRAGSMAVSLDAFRNYFCPEGPAWPFERQALVKLRPIAGDPRLGEGIARLRDELIYTGEPFDAAAMRGMRQRQLRQLVTPGTFNAKLSPGGLVDAEYLVQGLQISHGAHDKTLRATNTLTALAALAEAGVLSDSDHEALRAGYLFLRQLIGSLRIVRGNAKDLTIPPADSEEFAFLARRLDYGDEIRRLQEDLNRHTGHVRNLVEKLLG